MSLKVAVVFSLAFVFVVAQQESHQHSGHENHEHHWVNVDVYYESLCADSKRFFTQQLYPSLQGNLSSYVNLTLVPYGKTKMEFKTNTYEFECHHGPNECEGNKIQACALRLIDGGRKTEGLGFNKIAIGFINCLMDRTVKNGDNITSTANECAVINNVNNLMNIQNCAAHTDGSNYLANLGQMTEAVGKPVKFVPTVVFNHKYNDADNTLAQTNFVKALCQYIHGEKPSECSGANSVQISLGVLALLCVVTKFFQ